MMADAANTKPKAQEAAIAAPEVALAAPVKEAAPVHEECASEEQVNALQCDIGKSNATADTIEHELQAMQQQTGGAAAESSEYAHAIQQAQAMRAAAAEATLVIANAPKDPRDPKGKKLLINAQTVLSLSNNIEHAITSASGEGARIDEAAAETHGHQEAKNQHAAAVAAKSPSRIAAVVKTCTHAVARCAGLGAVCKVVPAAAHGWFGIGLVDDASAWGNGFANHISNGWNCSINWFAETGKSLTAGYEKIDITGGVKRAWGGLAWAGSAAMEHVENGMSAAGAGIASGWHAAMGKISSLGEAAKHGLHAAKEMLGNTVNALNPLNLIHHATPLVARVAAHHAPHSPAMVQEGGIHHMLHAAHHAVVEEIKVLSHHLPSLSLPHLSDLLPSHTPFSQGLSLKMLGVD